MKRLAAVLVLAILAVGCGGVGPPRPPAPSPSPTPVPSPVPPQSTAPAPTLLHVEGNAFVNAQGQRVWLLGSGGVCCHLDPAVNRWPWASEKLMRDIASHGGNFIHIRMGPNSKVLEPRPNMRPYLDGPDGKPDMGKWNETFFNDLNDFLDLAYSLGLYVEIDVLDAWELKDPPQSAFPDGSNDVNVLRHAPQLVHQHFINKLVREVGAHKNILWQMSNESGVPMETVNGVQQPIVSLLWELGIADAIRNEEDKLVPKVYHPRGTNSGIAKVEKHGDIDYIETHQCAAPEQPHYTGKPVMVNECNPESGANFKKQLTVAERNGTYYQLWWSDMSNAQWAQSLDLILEYRKTHPTK